MRKVIWGEPELVGIGESAGKDYKAKFIEAVAELIMEALRISWPDRRIFRALMISAIGQGVSELLRQYLHSQLEIIGNTLNREFDIDEEIETGHATHAKLSNFVAAIKQLMKEMEKDVNGTEEEGNV